MSDGRFQGWYYKQRMGDYMLAFIPGRAADGPFVQMIDAESACALAGTSRSVSMSSEIFLSR